MKFYWLCDVASRHFSGWYEATHKWSLPGAHCPKCDAIWSTHVDAYPSVDLSVLPNPEKYAARLEEDYAEFERLREQVRPLVPEGVPLWPGTEFGPLEGAAKGEFSPLVLCYPWTLLMKREAVERLQAEGLAGLKGCRTELRFRKKNPPELLELELSPLGQLHPDCLPEGWPGPCSKCGRSGFSLPEAPILDAASLSRAPDLFRLAGFLSLIIGTERFVEAARRLGYEKDLVFRELPLK
ncbi:double-CXXCG motif protein [Hyalangium rubrum]|uniref:Double-CXXCG motif protein n=1 Tax=Hyalangium rubrum TaxID=3103134 RepID=A0ABU5HCU9_9BACT|nr:double-CXXCG motif protein [Hyalangium sp. s54d21]MDY7231289.1 double-CXXCG motif protein [Hyalangium sp. s54d21]